MALLFELLEKMTRPKMKKGGREYLPALAADERGNILELPGYAACGASGELVAPLGKAETEPLPHGSELMMLPGRSPLVFDLDRNEMAVLRENPFSPGERLFAVAAFNAPAWLVTRTAAFSEDENAGPLPLFAYGAVGWGRGGARSAVVLVDPSDRQNLRLMPLSRVKTGVAKVRKALPDNRLARHLEKCALVYGCPAAKNFFLGREEAPLPTAPACNARCLGCISLQKDSEIPSTQDRISFMPTPEEIAQVALFHLARVPNGVVSFGQGCEGDPLLAASVIAPAVRLIRAATDKGTININTNAGATALLESCLDAGMDSIRVSMNSARKSCYEAYFRPSYSFSDVLASIDLALSRKIWVSINYLSMAGFTDSAQEAEALFDFLARHPINFIQWRNLNFDPLLYHCLMNKAEASDRPIGMKRLLAEIRRRFPKVGFGYFNPALR